MKLVAAICIVLLSGCAGSARTSGQPSDLSTASDAVMPSAPPTSAPPSATAEETAEAAADLLECDGPLSEMGGLANDFGVDAGGATPDQAFQAWIVASPFPIPRSGYRPLESVGDRSTYVYLAEGDIKVVVVISPRFARDFGFEYAIDEMRTCDPSEYGAAVDLGPGRRAWVHQVTGELLTDIEGSSHCEWQSARLLHVSDEEGRLVKQYVRDPEGVFDDVPSLLDDYAEGVSLPSDAVDSGYRTEDGLELWFTASDTAAYVVTPDGVERWPRADPPIGCA